MAKKTTTTRPKRFYRVRELAEELGLNEHTVRVWIRDGVIPARRIRKVILVDINDIEQVMKPYHLNGSTNGANPEE